MSIEFTALHRLLGRPPGPITNELLQAAVDAGIEETDILDWKQKPPAAGELKTSDFPKDIAAMANRGGGTIVYGVAESQKQATGRIDVGPIDESYQSTFHKVAASGINPPLLNLGVHLVGEEPERAVIVVVPASVDSPHLIWRKDYFAMPIRNGADTIWAQEAQLAAMYRARFDEQRHTAEALRNLYDEAALGLRTTERAWFVGVARPRIPAFPLNRPTREDARKVFIDADLISIRHTTFKSPHPLRQLDVRNPRPGLRRWNAFHGHHHEKQEWLHAAVSVHHDGSATLVSAIGGGRRDAEEHFTGAQMFSNQIEAAVADLLGLIRATSDARGTSEYEVRVGIEWAGSEPLEIGTNDQHGFPFTDHTTPLVRFHPVTESVVADTDEDTFVARLREFAEDCVNQGGITYLQEIKSPDDPSYRWR